MPSANDPNQGVIAKFHMVEKPKEGGGMQMIEYLEITHAGDKHYRRDQKVTQEDRERFPDEYRRFKEGIADNMSGTRLTIAADALQLSVSRITELNAVNVYTVEQLANTTDGNLPGLGMGGQMLRDKAREWLEEQMTKPDPNEMMDEIKRLRAEMEDMRAKRGPGRPKKAEAA